MKRKIWHERALGINWMSRDKSVFVPTQEGEPGGALRTFRLRTETPRSNTI